MDVQPTIHEAEETSDAQPARNGMASFLLSTLTRAMSISLALVGIGSLSAHYRRDLLEVRDLLDRSASHFVQKRYFFLHIAWMTFLTALPTALLEDARASTLAPNIVAGATYLAIYVAQTRYPTLRFLPTLSVFFALSMLIYMAYRHGGIVAPAFPLIAPLAAVSMLLVSGLARLFSFLGLALVVVMTILSVTGHFGEPTPLSPMVQRAHHIILTCFAAWSSCTLIYLFVMDNRLAMRELKEQAAELDRTSRARANFLAVASHEMRTPMNAILGSLDALNEARTPDEQAEFLEIVRDAGMGLTTYLDDLLDLSRVETGNMSLSPAPVDLVELLRRTLNLWRARATDKDITLEGENLSCELGVLVLLDRVRVQQVMSNLLSNAIKFTPEGGRIALRLDCEAMGDGRVDVQISVTDTGPGVAPEDRERIFEAFQQVRSNQAHSGAGLGLAISRQLIRAMKGEIRIEAGPGVGSRFVVELSAPIHEEAASGAARPAAPSTTSALRILVVDDHAVNLRIAEILLGALSYDVSCVNSGEAALETCRNETFDVILMDMLMPGMDGLETSRRLRREPGANALTPIIALTANVMPEQIDHYLASGVDGVVAKPIDVRELASRLEEVVGG